MNRIVGWYGANPLHLLALVGCFALAGYAAASLASGTASLTTGSSFTAGKLGSYTVLAPSGTTGPSVVLGPPTVFDNSNIDQFNF